MKFWRLVAKLSCHCTKASCTKQKQKYVSKIVSNICKSRNNKINLLNEMKDFIRYFGWTGTNIYNCELSIVFGRQRVTHNHKYNQQQPKYVLEEPQKKSCQHFCWPKFHHRCAAPPAIYNQPGLVQKHFPEQQLTVPNTKWVPFFPYVTHSKDNQHGSAEETEDQTTSRSNDTEEG